MELLETEDRAGVTEDRAGDMSRVSAVFYSV